MKPRVGFVTRVVKGKLISVHVIKACGGVEVQSQIFLTAAIGGGNWSASHYGCFTPRERGSCVGLIGGREVSRGGTDAFACAGNVKCIKTLVRKNI
jgi:hypothetical protein